MLLDCGREVYLPAVDDHGVDIIVRTADYDATALGSPNSFEFQELQVKSVSQGGLFAALKCDHPRANYWFVFYIKDIDKMWLINSEQLVKIASCVTKPGSKNLGKFTIDLKPVKRTPIKFPQYHITDFTNLP
jgi:hypothetical protein